MRVAARIMVAVFGILGSATDMDPAWLIFVSNRFGLFIHATVFFLLVNVSAAIFCAMGHIVQTSNLLRRWTLMKVRS